MRSYCALIKNISLTLNLTPTRINLWLSISLFINTRVESITNDLPDQNAKLKNLLVGKPSKGSKGQSPAPFMRHAPASGLDKTRISKILGGSTMTSLQELLDLTRLLEQSVAELEWLDRNSSADRVAIERAFAGYEDVVGRIATFPSWSLEAAKLTALAAVTAADFEHRHFGDGLPPPPSMVLARAALSSFAAIAHASLVGTASLHDRLPPEKGDA